MFQEMCSTAWFFPDEDRIFSPLCYLRSMYLFIANSPFYFFWTKSYLYHNTILFISQWIRFSCKHFTQVEILYFVLLIYPFLSQCKDLRSIHIIIFITRALCFNAVWHWININEWKHWRMKEKLHACQASALLLSCILSLLRMIYSIIFNYVDVRGCKCGCVAMTSIAHRN